MKRILLLLILPSFLMANNIEINNISLENANDVDGWVHVEFDLSWENSWRISAGPSNWDAAWVFVKFRINNGDWQHASLNYVNGTSDGHISPSGATIKTPDDGLGYSVGVFIHRDSDGSGDVSWQDVALRWNYQSDGVDDSDIIDVQVFGIEMVNIPEGEFRLGGTGTEVDRFYDGGSISNPYLVNSENAITVGNSAGNLYYSVASFENNGDQSGPIPAAFPKGYQSFYIMKYEVSEDQWIAFFNTLTDAHKLEHDLTDVDHKNTDAIITRNTISYTTGDATTSAPSRALNFTSYNDVSSYLDWCGLRPLTELEYEKAARGPIAPVADEFSWGTDNVYDAGVYTITNDGTESALITNPGTGVGNMTYSTTDPAGPTRVGIFAASALTNNREETGGSYYGVMELSGNLYERLIGVGTAANRAFTGNHGDGELSSAGRANVTQWPTNLSIGMIAYRGGSHANASIHCRIGDRSASAVLSSITNSRIGFRGGRTDL